MARVLVTGSADGLGQMAARLIVAAGPPRIEQLALSGCVTGPLADSPAPRRPRATVCLHRALCFGLVQFRSGQPKPA